MPSDLISIYRRKVDSGDLSLDPAQKEALLRLELIRCDLERATRSNKSLWGRLRKPVLPPSKGLYLCGDVGTGKSMLMDLFFDATQITGKRRVHFHAFMQEIHHALDAARKQKLSAPVVKIAADIARKVRLLCFDELQITNIADAMIVGQIFAALFKEGVTLVTTSNRAPDDLYKNGLNRELFLPFIALIKERLNIHPLMSALDYRRTFLHREQTWFSPLGAPSTTALDTLWQELTKGQSTPQTLLVEGRKLLLPHFLKDMARATFDELCGAPLGPADFLAISKTVKLLIIDDIPSLTSENNDAATRFVILIDSLYEAGACLICSAETPPEGIYEAGSGTFEFRRTASRLAEMQSTGWGSSGP